MAYRFWPETACEDGGYEEPLPSFPKKFCSISTEI